MSQWSRSSKFVLGPASWKAHYKQADNTGWASSSAFTLSPPPLVKWQHNVCVLVFFLWLYKFPGKDFSYSFLSIVALFQQHPSHPHNVGKGPKTIISQGKAGAVVWTVIILLVTVIKNMQGTNISNQCCYTLSHVQWHLDAQVASSNTHCSFFPSSNSVFRGKTTTSCNMT